MTDRTVVLEPGWNNYPIKLIDLGDGTYALATTATFAGDVVFGASVEVTNDAGNPLPVTSTQLAASLGQKAMAASNAVVIASDQSALQVIGNTPRLTGSVSRPADATQYSIGDILANSGTAASVVPITFTLTRTSGRISGCRCVVTPASGNLVITALDFDLLLFRPEASIPFAAAGYPADNAALAITAAAMKELVGIFRFTSGGWRNPAGALTAGVTGYQAQPLYSPTSTPRPYAPFNVVSTGASTLLGLIQMQGAWNPGNVVNALDFALDVDLD